METKDFIEQLDLNKDSQISKQDIKSLGEFLNKEDPKYNKEFVEKLEKDPKFKEVLFAIEPSFLDVINSKDFVINPENKENIIILQFFAKYFRGENVEINGQFTPETEKLYLESSLQTKSLDQNTFSGNNELELFKTWLGMNNSITLQIISREEFDKIKPNITEKNNLKGDGKDKPQGYNLKIPEDLKNTETPMLMKSVNQIAYGDKLPEQSAFKTYQSKLEANIKYLESIEDEANQNPDTKAQYEKLMGKLEQMKGDYYGNEDGVDDNIVENELGSINGKMSLEFQDINNEQIKGQKDNPKIKMMLLEKMISKDLRNYTDLAVFERGTETLFDYLTTPTKKEHEYLLDEGKRKEAGVIHIEDGFVDKKIESMSDVKQKLKDSIGVEKYKEELEGLEGEERISKEKEICQKILEQINLYPRTDMGNSKTGEPSKILETQKMVCLGKSIIAGGFLQELGIKFDTLNVWGHSALMVYLSDGKEYYFDPTNATDIAEFENKQKVEGGTYEKGKAILPNKFANGGKIDLGSNGAHGDSDGKLHFTKADPEFGLMGQMYNNKSNNNELSKKESLFFRQRANEINPNCTDSYVYLIGKNFTYGNYDEAVKMAEKGLSLDKENKQILSKISPLIFFGYIKNGNIDKGIELCKHFLYISGNNGNIMDLWGEIVKVIFDKGDKQNAYELAEKGLSYREDALCLDILAKREIDSGNYEKANEFLSRAGKVAVQQDTITRTIDNLQLLQSKVKSNKPILESIDKVSELISDDLEKSINDNINNKKFEEARELTNELVKIKPWFGYYKLGYISKGENKNDDMVKNFQKAIELAPDDTKEAIKKELEFIKSSG